MRVLWHGILWFVPTGYGTQTKNCLLPLRDTYGHEVAFFAKANYNAKAIMKVDGIRIYPFGDMPDGSDVVSMHVQHWGADCLIGLYDAWTIPGGFHQGWEDVPYVMLAPIDAEPMGNVNINHINANVDFPVAFSRFGFTQMEEAGIKNVSYVPHSINTEAFSPLSPEDRGKVRAMRKWEDGQFWIGMFGANIAYPNRKAIPESLLAVAEFQRRHEDAYLYLHAYLYPPGNHPAQGLFLGDVIEGAGIDLDRIAVVEPYSYQFGMLNETYMGRLYSACDVVLHPSYGEGFGLCIAEAQASGTPVITCDHSSMTELTVNGICMEPLQPFWSGLGGWWAMPSVERILDALEDLYDRQRGRPQEHAEQSAKGAEFIHTNYAIPHVMETYWVPLMAKVAKERERRLRATSAKADKKERMRKRRG